jgi:hypothetical protein
LASQDEPPADERYYADTCTDNHAERIRPAPNLIQKHEEGKYARRKRDDASQNAQNSPRVGSRLDHFTFPLAMTRGMK